MSRLSGKQEQAVQAIGMVAQLGGLVIKNVTIADDLENVTLTVKFTGVSQGWVQEVLDFDVVDLRAHVNGRGEVERLDGLQTGDRAETGAEADELIAAEAAGKQADPDDDEPQRDIHLVGEVAAAARKRRS